MCQKLYVSEFQDEVQTIYMRLSPQDRIRICAVTSNATPGMYPLLGAKPHKKFKAFYSKKNAKYLKNYIDAFGQIVLPKHILLINNDTTYYLGPRYTRYSERSLTRYKLHQLELENSFVITKLSSESISLNNSDSNISLNAPSSMNSNLNVESTYENSESEEIAEEGRQQTLNDRNDQTDEARSVQPDDNRIEQSGSNRREQPDANRSEHQGESHNQEKDPNSDQRSKKTEPEYSVKHTNIFRIPEKLNNEKIMHLLHCSKSQFLSFVESLRPHMKVDEDFLSIYARVFLFRFKVIFRPRVYFVF